jgi:hypothetical protein
MNRSRRLVANAVILFVLIMTFRVISNGHEAWPFFNYPMFRDLNLRGDRDSYSTYIVVAGKETKLRNAHGNIMDIPNLIASILDMQSMTPDQKHRFLVLSLRVLQHQARAESLPVPEELKIYHIQVQYPDKPDYMPVELKRQFVTEILPP